MNYFFVYILKCKDGSYYIGHTDNLEKRIAEHNEGKIEGYTSKRLPVECVFAQPFNTRDEAIITEHKIKKWTRSKKEALIKNNWQDLSKLAKKKFK